MKILIPVLAFGKSGGDRVLSKLADELIRSGNTVEFLCPGRNDIPYYPTTATIRWINDNGTLSNQNNVNGGKAENAISIQRKLKKALSQIPKNSYDAVIANHSLTILPVIRSGWNKKALYYVQGYEPDFYRLMGGIKNNILCKISTFSYSTKLFTVVNAEIYLNYKKLKASRILYPGVDFNIFYPAQKKTATGKIIIGTVGRLERFKGTQHILDAYKVIKEKYPNSELHVAFGDPAGFKQYKDVYCFQPHGDEALGNFYRTLDYYICAGFTHPGAFHYPVVEAMCCAVSVITTTYYPANTTNAWIIETPAAIVTQFEQALKNPELKEKKIQQALTDIKQFDWHSVGLKLKGYLEELISSRQAD